MTFALSITSTIINYYSAYCHYSLHVNKIKYHIIAESSFFILSGYQKSEKKTASVGISDLRYSYTRRLFLA